MYVPRVIHILPLISITVTTTLVMAESQREKQPPSPFIRGFALGQYSAISEAELNTKLLELVNLGVSHVSLVTSWSTVDIHSTHIAPLTKLTTPQILLERMIVCAHNLGLKVMLFPILDVQNRKLQEWRGTLKPRDWNKWWSNYSQFILHYASLAARTQVAMLCIGSELVTTERMREQWKRLIRQIRKIYSGSIIYSANWDHYEPVTFWDLVDAVGLTGYYRLAQKAHGSEQEMLASWTKIRNRLISWSKKISRPILFTEVGYPSLAGGAVNPWDYTQHSASNPEEQRRAYWAFIKAWTNIPQLSGVFFWDWYGPGGAKDRQYTPRGKPAAPLIKKWFLNLSKTAH